MSIMSSGVSGLLNLSSTSKYGDIRLGDFGNIFTGVYVLWIMAKVLFFGGLNVINCAFLCRFMSFV